MRERVLVIAASEQWLRTDGWRRLVSGDGRACGEGEG